MFGGQAYTFSEFLEKAKELSRAGVSIDDIPLDIPVPPSVMNAIRELTGNNPFLNMEIVRVYREVMRTRPPLEQADASVQEKVGMNVVNYFKDKKTKNTPDTADDMPINEFLRFTVKSYGDVAFDDSSVVIKQIPDALLTELNITDTPAMGEVRRLFVEVENEIKKHQQVAAHLRTLDSAARETYMNPIRGQIKDKIKPAIAEKIEGLAPDKVKSELQKYYAVVDFTVADNGRTVNIVKIELKEKQLSGTALIPETLINGLDARSSVLRFAAVARLWASVIELAPEAARPGQLQDNLVNSIIGQRNNATTDELLRTIVISVDKDRGTVQLGYAPQGIRSPQSPAWGEGEITGSSVTIFERYLRENPNLTPEQQATLATAIREAVENFERAHAGEQVLSADIRRDENGNFHVTITRAGGVGGDPTVNNGWFTDGEASATYQYGSEGHAGEGSVTIDVGHTWPKFRAFIRFGIVGYGNGDYLTNSDAASFQMIEGPSSALRLNYSSINIGYNDGNNKIGAGAGLLGVRYGTDNPASNPDYNTQFGLFPIPDIDTSRMLGANIYYTRNFENVDLTVGALGGYGLKLTLWPTEDQASFTKPVFGGQLGIDVMLHKPSKTQLNLQAIGYYPGLVTIGAGLYTHFHEHVILSLYGRYSHIWTDDNPDTEDLYAVSLAGQFPFRVAGIGLIPFLVLSLGGRQGTAGWSGEAVNGGCTHIGIDCGENLVDLGYRGFSGNAGLETKLLNENSPVQLGFILGGNVTYGTSLTSGANAGIGGAGYLQFKLTW